MTTLPEFAWTTECRVALFVSFAYGGKEYRIVTKAETMRFFVETKAKNAMDDDVWVPYDPPYTVDPSVSELTALGLRKLLVEKMIAETTIKRRTEDDGC